MRLWAIAIWAGGAALLAAALTDTASVIGRHIDMPVYGAIELIQPAILVAGSIALLIAVARRSHARVMLLVQRMPEGPGRVAELLGRVTVALAFAVLAAGSIWIMIDLWTAHETSELRKVPWRAMRLFASVLLLACAVAALGRERPARIEEAE